jgi:hypothetical protein
MKRSLLERLRTNGISYLMSAFLLLLAIPLYQLLFLNRLGYGNALHQASSGSNSGYSAYLKWIGEYSWQFLLYRALLALAFVLLFTLPFALFRIIVAQEITAQADSDADEDKTEEEDSKTEEEQEQGMPAHAWRGKGFAIIAVWAGIVGVVIYVLGTIASTLYTLIVSSSIHISTAVPVSYAGFSAFFTILAQTVGIGLLAISTLFFGAMIARAGRNLWPGVWVAFGYMALAVAALLSGSAVAVASTPGEGQAALTTPAILIFALWVLWLGILLARLKAEPET